MQKSSKCHDATRHRLAVIPMSLAIVIMTALPASAQQPVSMNQVNASLFGANVASIPDVTERAIQSVVNVKSMKKAPDMSEQMRALQEHPFFRYFYEGRGANPRGGQPAPGEEYQNSLGSGVIVSSTGIVLTNNHVVAKADSVKISLNNGDEFECDIVGTDPESDLAVLRIKKAPANLVPMKIGDSDQLRLGETVLAIGNPFGVGQTVTMGIVSAKGRSDVGIVDYENFIQTDAAINPGNSGGALINSKGELVGINTAILSRSGGYQGVGFAIPSKMAMAVQESLVRKGHVSRGFLGIGLDDISRDVAKALKLKGGRGVSVTEVAAASPAVKAGLVAGDIVTHIDSEAILSARQLRNRIGRKAPGTRIKLRVLRDQKSKSLVATLGTRPGDEALANTQKGKAKANGRAGMELEAIRKSLKERFNIHPQVNSGLVITGVAPKGAAARMGLKPGDVILSVNQSKVSRVKNFEAALQKSEGDVLLLVARGRRIDYVMLKL